MNEPSSLHKPSRLDEALLHSANKSVRNAAISVDRSEELDHRGRTAAQRHALFMNGFRNILQVEGLRSPSYYHDKSQCISFEDCTPAEMGIIKAERLKWGYVESKELVKRLRQLKPSQNFSLRKFRPPRMTWDKSPIPTTPRIIDHPEPDWLFLQIGDIVDLERRLGERQTKIYRDEARNYWNKVCDIELAPLPDIYYLTHINQSPSGTLFPRYLVKALRELLDAAHKRGVHYYNDKETWAVKSREETICRWSEDHPDEILAEDAISMYHRTWPAQLMAQLDSIDQEAIREGRMLYMTDLETTGRKMEKLVAFWQNCGLVTGTRTPPSPPDPRSEFRYLVIPLYFSKRLHIIESEPGGSYNDKEKRKMIEEARWKEVVLHTHCDPMTSELRLTEPLLRRGALFRDSTVLALQRCEDIWKSWESSEVSITESLQQKLDVIWKGWESSIDDEYVEDDMIDVLSLWRRGEEILCSNSSGTPEPDSNAEMLRSGFSRSDARAWKAALQFLRGSPRTKSRFLGLGDGLATNCVAWSDRLRPRS